MWLDQVNEISEMFRYTLPTSIFIISMIIILSPADAAHEFPVYRLQHFDLQGIKYGILFLFFFFSKSINSEPLFHSFFFFFPTKVRGVRCSTSKPVRSTPNCRRANVSSWWSTNSVSADSGNWLTKESGPFWSSFRRTSIRYRMTSKK